MSIRLCFFFITFFITTMVLAADKDFLSQQQRLCHSNPIRTSRESSEKTPLLSDAQKQDNGSPRGHRNSAPARFSLDEIMQLADVVIRTRSSGSGTIKNSPTSSPKLPKNLRTSNSSKKHFLINAENINCGFLETIRQEVKRVATEASLKKSSFYAVFRQMRPEFIKSNAVAFAFANYFICMVAQHESCKKHLNVRGSQYTLPSTGDFLHCVCSIRAIVDTVTSNTITWPSVEREDHLTVYYQELLEKNQTINVSLVCAPYLGSVIATELLKNTKSQSDTIKTFFADITTDNPKRAKKYCKELVAQFAALQLFVPAINVQLHKLTDQENQE